MAPPNRRGGSGPKKTGIGRIEQEDARYVCYSKRRVGFFTKATDLSVLTGAQVAALAFSPRCRAISFGHPSVDSVVERFLAGEAAGAGARKEDAADDRLLAGEGAGKGAGEGAAGEDKKLEKLDRAHGQGHGEIAPRDKDMATFFAALMQVKGVVSDRANQVLLEAMHSHMSHMAEVGPPPPPQIFSGSTFEFGSSSGTANDGMEFQFLRAGWPWFLLPLPQEQGFEAAMDMQQMVMAALPPSQVVAAGMDMQETPPPPGLAAGMDMEQMQMTMPKPPGFDAGLDM
ncbi:uncharacterized protein LOC125547395 [Triticum urartu]|uniref:uncharacterized protein LOC125547395 n=1 Tax=Triticum urartu TaxID=4572 RepID=UPI002043AFCA|nr:uncharacterized protein LOC125547395 [Triticum urartu]